MFRQLQTEANKRQAMNPARKKGMDLRHSDSVKESMVQLQISLNIPPFMSTFTVTLQASIRSVISVLDDLI